MRLTKRRCFVCDRGDNPIVISETPVEERFGVPVIPAAAYELAACRNCGTLYVDCDVTDEYLETLYRSESLEWQKEFMEQSGSGNVIGPSRLPEFVAHWRQMISIRSPRRGEQLLDVGCQTGEFGLIAMRDGVVPHGIELSPDYAKRAREAWGGVSMVISRPLTATDFPGIKFHYVTAFETLEHMPNPRACLQQVREIIDPSGILAISVPSTSYFLLKFRVIAFVRHWPTLFQTLLGRRALLYSRQILPHTHLFNFAPRAVRLLLRQSGFDVVSVRAVGWVGRSAVLTGLSDAVMAATGGRYAMAPSVLAIARPV